jgi:1-acyl-sn-glycerol-3-phosphate acyltransferase
MSATRTMKLITGIMEAILAIPVLGAIIIVSNGWMPLIIMLVLHIITLLLAVRVQGPLTGSIVGIVAACLGWIPFVGWILHAAAAIVLLVESFSRRLQQ